MDCISIRSATKNANRIFGAVFWSRKHHCKRRGRIDGQQPVTIQNISDEVDNMIQQTLRIRVRSHADWLTAGYVDHSVALKGSAL